MAVRRPHLDGDHARQSVAAVLLRVAGVLLTILRRAGLQGTELANARFDTIRARLIKLAGRIKVSVRWIRISLSSVYPLQELFTQALTALRAALVCVAPVRVAPG